MYRKPLRRPSRPLNLERLAGEGTAHARCRLVRFAWYKLTGRVDCKRLLNSRDYHAKGYALMVQPTDSDKREARARGTPVEVFSAFLKLGLTSFGGPIAHLGYFRTEFVE